MDCRICWPRGIELFPEATYRRLTTSTIGPDIFYPYTLSFVQSEESDIKQYAKPILRRICEAQYEHDTEVFYPKSRNLPRRLSAPCIETDCPPKPIRAVSVAWTRRKVLPSTAFIQEPTTISDFAQPPSCIARRWKFLTHPNQSSARCRGRKRRRTGRTARVHRLLRF